MKARGEPWEARHEFEGRPSLFALLGLVVGLTSLSHPANLTAILLLFWLRSLTGRCWCALFFIIGLVLSPVQPGLLNGRQFIEDTGVVSGSIRHEGSRQVCQIEVSRGSFFLQLENGPELKFGDRIDVRGVAVPLGASEERTSRLLTLGTLRAGPGDVSIAAPNTGVSALADRWRSSFEETVYRALPQDVADTVSSSVLGVNDVSPEFTRRLRAAGAISLASVSGLQVLLLSALVIGGVGRLPLYRSTVLLILGATLLIYAMASGLHPGAIRASIMTVLMSSAYLLRRDPDVLSALGLSALIELLWRPVWVFDFGLQMSFMVVATLALWLPSRSTLARRSFLTKACWAGACVVAMFVAAAPLIAYQTGELDFQAPLVGSLIVPAVPPMFVFGLFGWLISLVVPAVGTLWMKVLVAPFAGWILACSDLASRWGGLSIQIPLFNAYLLLPVYALLALGARVTSNAFAGERS